MFVCLTVPKQQMIVGNILVTAADYYLAFIFFPANLVHLLRDHQKLKSIKKKSLHRPELFYFKRLSKTLKDNESLKIYKAKLKYLLSLKTAYSMGDLFNIVDKGRSPILLCVIIFKFTSPI